MARLLLLRDGLGARIGTALLFHPAECLEALPHGEDGENEDVQASQEDLKDRLESLFEDLTHGGTAFGVLWITVDQAHEFAQDPRRRRLRSHVPESGADAGSWASTG
jgi:hypothetical protein